MQPSDGPESGVSTEIIGSLSVIRFIRPTQRNTLSRQILDELDQTLSSLFARPELRAIILTGSEDIFASGANLNELVELDERQAQDFSELGQNLFRRIAQAEQITIAAINGFCMGGALDLALACDIRVASSTAIFSHPGARLGIITGWGGTQRLARLIGRARALEFFVTARRYLAEEAVRIGLVAQVADPVLECAIEVAAEAKAMPPSGGSLKTN